MAVTIMCDHCDKPIGRHGATFDHWEAAFTSIHLASFTLHFHPDCGVELLGKAVPRGYAEAIQVQGKQVIR